MYQKKATCFSYDILRIETEYDFQNLIQFILRLIFSNIVSELFLITIDGNKKKANFSVNDNKIVIKTKWIDTTNKKDNVLKTLKRFSDFYIQNSNICSLIFLIFYKKEISLDRDALEYFFSFEKRTPPIFVCFMESDYT